MLKRKKIRYILHIKNTPNNVMFNLADFAGNTKFFFTAKARRYKSKQVRRTIVIEALGKYLIERLKNFKFTYLGLKFNGTFSLFKKIKLIKLLRVNGFNLINLELAASGSFNGCKTKHFRRI